ncbi:MAG: protein kinase [Labilithrix sp.]|nr:protein kinase [Labilithrix sp.]MCW5814429.1 protein kinase [Labilithrix sp.]
MADTAPATVDSMLGRTVGHFRIDALLGYGGMGAVYRAWDLSLERPVALKTVLFESEHTRALFVREARAQAKLRHPNVVPVHFIGEHEGHTYLVMELVEGESLAAKLEREGRLPEARALEIVDAVAAALESAHGQGLIHRDVKPSNVLVENAGRVLLADFGLAKGVGAPIPVEEAGAHRAVDKSGIVTHTKGTVGTPAYIAPELTAGGGEIDHRADIYSLGVTLYEVVTGTRPFSGPTNSRVAAAHERAPVIAPRIIEPKLSEATEAVILRMLAKTPAERFPTYADLRRAIADIRVQRVPAAFLSRAGAFLIDLTPFAILNSVLLWSFPRGESRPLVWLLAAAVYAWFESRKGATWGKRLVGIHTINELGRRPTFSRAFVRGLVKLWAPLAGAVLDLVLYHGGTVLSMQVNGVGPSTPPRGGQTSAIVTALWVIWIVLMFLALRKDRLTLHDRAAKTRVLVDLGAA